MTPTFLLQNTPIFLAPLAEAFPVWLNCQHYSQIFILSDENTQQHCLPYFLKKTGLPEKSLLTVIKPGEPEKTLATCEKIWQAMLAAQLDRKSLVINLGGGVIGDMGGFCAATWKRGIDFIQIPTTLLSMTDAAIGGKTGIDFQGIKNIIGVFKQPTAVFVDPVFLQTLPERELHSGYAEVIKHALIGDPSLAHQLTQSGQTGKQKDWFDILHKSIAVKVRVVEEDPLEKGLRMILNFGHSIGHALETWFLETESPLTHGEAIYIGMICEAYLSSAGKNLSDEIQQLGGTIFPKIKIPESAFPTIWNSMLQDKKNSSGTVRMAVPDEKPFSIKVEVLTAATLQQSLQYYNAL